MTNYASKAITIHNVTDDTPAAEEFNTLLSALRNAGYLATE